MVIQIQNLRSKVYPKKSSVKDLTELVISWKSRIVLIFLANRIGNHIKNKSVPDFQNKIMDKGVHIF